MKIRNGFVSNSSSSSFIVAFPKKPETFLELKSIMFNDDDFHAGEKTCDIAESVFKQLEKYSFVFDLPEKVIFAAELGCNPYDILHKAFGDDFERDNNDLFWAMESYLGTLDYGDISEFHVEHKDKFIGKFEFGDECSDWDGFLEHNNIFKNLPHIRINHH